MEVMGSNVWPAGFHRADFEKTRQKSSNLGIMTINTQASQYGNIGSSKHIYIFLNACLDIPKKLLG